MLLRISAPSTTSRQTDTSASLCDPVRLHLSCGVLSMRAEHRSVRAAGLRQPRLCMNRYAHSVLRRTGLQHAEPASLHPPSITCMISCTLLACHYSLPQGVIIRFTRYLRPSCAGTVPIRGTGEGLKLPSNRPVSVTFLPAIFRVVLLRASCPRLFAQYFSPIRIAIALLACLYNDHHASEVLQGGTWAPAAKPFVFCTFPPFTSCGSESDSGCQVPQLTPQRR